MDYLARNIKDSYNQKTVLVNSNRTSGSTVMFFSLLIVWGIMVAAYRLMWKLMGSCLEDIPGQLPII